jgi:creatinine amidohydrolase
MTLALADLTWPQVGQRPGTLLVIPLGATEQHGPHLPLSMDTDVAVALCQGLAANRTDVLVAPALPYGSSGEHAGFPGTLSIGQEALELVVVELARSATDSSAQVLFVSGHGGNNEPLTRAITRLRGEGRDVRAFAPTWDGDAHAGRTETGLALALDPSRVLLDEAAPGDTRPLAAMLPELRTGGVRAVSPTGVLGDPTGADAEEGKALLEQLIDDLTGAVNRWWP